MIEVKIVAAARTYYLDRWIIYQPIGHWLDIRSVSTNTIWKSKPCKTIFVPFLIVDWADFTAWWNCAGSDCWPQKSIKTFSIKLSCLCLWFLFSPIIFTFYSTFRNWLRNWAMRRNESRTNRPSWSVCPRTLRRCCCAWWKLRRSCFSNHSLLLRPLTGASRSDDFLFVETIKSICVFKLIRALDHGC